MSFSVNEITKSPWLKASDVDEMEDTTLTILEAYLHEFTDRDTGQTEKKPVIKFGEIDQKLVLNKTRLVTLGKAFGDDSNAWLSRQVILDTHPTPAGDTITVKGIKTGGDKQDDKAAEISFE